MQVTFREFTGKLVLCKYDNGRTALTIEDEVDGELIAVCTVNVPEVNLAPGLVAIKDYSENEGMLEALFNQGIVDPPQFYIENGFVRIPVCKLLIDDSKR